MRRAAAFVAVAMAFPLIVAAGCGGGPQDHPAKAGKALRLATTTSTFDSGLLNALLPEFTRGTGIRVEVISHGTDAAIALARQGRADILMTHARSEENALVMEGYGVNRVELMHNDFLLLGPLSDPAAVAGTGDIVTGLKRIHEIGALFLSRGDRSGTHLRELSLWRLAGITPDGPQYLQTGKGMGATLEQADKQGAYVLSDRGTWLSLRERLRLMPVIEGDQRLLNVYSVTLINPLKQPGVDFPGAMALLEFLVSPEGQEIIREYGKSEFGQPLFVPMVIP
ncbi:MAG TPA: substrate-binding domain-containing protein [Phycisphaerae bacterium]|nr:substrate-binding domain-containing protein [Phycisphaerae bacterium]